MSPIHTQSLQLKPYSARSAAGHLSRCVLWRLRVQSGPDFYACVAVGTFAYAAPEMLLGLDSGVKVRRWETAETI